MTVRMENSTEIDKPVTGADKDMGATAVAASDEAGQDNDDTMLFCRERQLVLLSALFKLYGVEWEDSPDWTKVAEEIKSAKIPIYGENFAPETCETFYKTLMDDGYQVGIGHYGVQLKVPGKLTDGQKRLWILAKTSADLAFTSERLDQAFREAYKEEYETLKTLYTGNSDIKSQAVAEALEVSSESGSDKGDKEEYEDPEAAKVAVELEQAELNKGILGFNDVLVMIQYCNDAAEYATKAFPQFEASLKRIKVQQMLSETVSLTGSSEPTPTKIAGKMGEIFSEQELESCMIEDLEFCLLPTPPKSSASTPITPSVEKEPAAVIVKPTPTVISISSEDDTPEKPKTPVKLSPVKLSPVKIPSKPNDHIVSQDIIEIDVSPDKSLTKANNKEKTAIPESKNATSDNSDQVPEPKCSGDNGKEPDPQPLVTVTNMKTVGITGPEENDFKRKPVAPVEPAKDAVVKEPPKSEPPVKEKSVVIELTRKPEEKEDKGTEKEKVAATQPVVPAVEVVDTPKTIPMTNASEVKDSNVGEDLNKTASSENSDIVEIFPEKEKEDKKQDEVVGKEKGQAQGQGTKKKESGRSTRTSSRLASPEPNDLPQQNEEQKSTNVKKTVSRQSSSQQPAAESPPHTPALRSRRGATPTKAVEVVVVGDSPVESVTRSLTPSKAGVPVAASTPAPASTEDTEEETFETPRSTPESTEMGKSSDVETTSKPLKPVKVYSVKPPSPLSQVDPSLLDEFIDEDEDAELVEIDSNVNKAKGLKGSSPSKSLSLRGRTVSSENASDAGGQTNEESTPSKRVTRKLGLNEDVEEDGASNNEEGESKRLTRSSLKLHDAANEESTEAPQTESEKAASESSFGGKEKKPRTSKQLLRVKKLHDEKNRFYGEDSEESPDGKRLTRAQRARTSTSSTSVAEKRSKPPSVGDSEGLSESEPTPTRATRSRSSTTTNTPAPVEPTPSSSQSQISTVNNVDDEEQKNLRKTIFSMYEKLVGSEAAAAILKSIQEDQSLTSKWNSELSQIKKNIEQGRSAVSISGFYFALNLATINVVMKLPNSNALQEAAETFAKLVQTTIEELKVKPGDLPQPPPKNDNSDVESLESHDEQRSEASSSTKQTPVAGASGGGRRKRKRSASETSEEVLPQENKRRVTRTSTSSSSTAYNSPAIRKTKHPISPDIVSANRVRH